MQKIWQECLTRLKTKLGLQDWSIFVNNISAEETKNKIILSSEDKNVLSWLKKNYAKKIAPIVFSVNKNITLEIKETSTKEHNRRLVIAKKLSSQLLKEHTFENMVVGGANNIVYHAAQNIANNIQIAKYNPFIIYGDSGLGKTHILQATAHLVKKLNPKISIIYTPLMQFVLNITNGIRHQRIEAIKRCYESADLLLIDDTHLIAGKNKSQEEFFHIYNYLFGNKKQIILTCDQMPSDIKSLNQRIKSRLAQGLILQLEPPELELRAAILIKKAKQQKIQLSEEIAFFYS